MLPYTLFGIEEQDYDRAKVVVMPVPYDSTTTYRAGTREGPHALINASRNIELYSEETEKDISTIGIYTAEELAPNFSSPENMVKQIEKEVVQVLEEKKMPLLIGGEHTISLGSLRPISQRNKKLTFLYFDAHSDSRDSFMGSKYSHACVAARAKELCGIYGVGIRSIDEESARKLGKNMLYMKEAHRMGTEKIIESIIKNTQENIYLSIDFDVLDSSEMPSVGTPEPDGFSFYQLKEIIKGVVEKKRVLGMDFVELNPVPGMVAPDYLAAKLVYYTLSYVFSGKG